MNLVVLVVALVVVFQSFVQNFVVSWRLRLCGVTWLSLCFVSSVSLVTFGSIVCWETWVPNC